MTAYTIHGGIPLKGTISVCGNKNAALPCVAACLLTEEPVTLKNSPYIEDVKVMCSIIEQLGATVQFKERKNEVTICAKEINSTKITTEFASKIRASFLFAGPLVARKRKAYLSPPGGDVIGKRRLDTHLHALYTLGVTVDVGDEYVFSAPNGIQGAKVFLDETSVTATENAIMASVLAHGETSIENAASEPHVQDLCALLIMMGAKIRGVGSNVLHIEGVKRLHGAEFTIGPDFMEVGSFIGLAAATRSELIINNIGDVNLRMIAVNFKKLGVQWEQDRDSIHVHATKIPSVKNDLWDAIPYIDDAPWPGFPADLISIALVVATQTKGLILLHEKMYESRLFFVDKLINMGAQIILCDPHRAIVNGPTSLRAANLTSPDVRAGMAMVIAALCATGKSVIHNVYQIKRGYENLIPRLQALGANISEQEI